MSVRTKRVVAVVAVALALVVGTSIWYVSDYYHAQPASNFAAQGSHSDAARLVEETDMLIKVGDPKSKNGIVFYPGAKVESSAYVPLAQYLADYGFCCAIVKMPFHLAMLDISAADDVIITSSSVENWWIVGHSLGGAMASAYAEGNQDILQGIVFLAAYPARDLSGTGLSALTLYGSEDGVLNRDKLQETAKMLPEDTRTSVIEGGNHAGFGEYGPQAGDGRAFITSDWQQQQTAEEIARFTGVLGELPYED